MFVLIMMAITIIGLIIILPFVKPTEKELKNIEEYEKAKNELVLVIAKTFKIDVLAEWLSKKLSK